MSCCVPKQKENVVLKSTVKENKEKSAVDVFLSNKVERTENVRPKNKTNNYFIIKIGEETYEKVNSAKFEKLLISKNINVEKVKWEKI